MVQRWPVRRLIDTLLVLTIFVGGTMLAYRLSTARSGASEEDKLQVDVNEARLDPPELPDRLMAYEAEIVGVVQAQCHACDQIVTVWNELATQGFSVIGIMNGLELEAKLRAERTGAAFPIISLGDAEFVEQITGQQGRREPVTLFVDSAGKIVGVHRGALWGLAQISGQLHRLRGERARGEGRRR